MTFLNEIGVFALVFAFVLSVAQASLVAAGQFKRLSGIERYSEGVSLAAALSP